MLELAPVLDKSIELDASDIHLTVGRPPTYRVYGDLQPADDNVLDAKAVASVVEQLIDEKMLHEYRQLRTVELAYMHKDGVRFRISIFRQKGVDSIAMRRIPSKILSMDEIGLPPVLKKILARKHGLILVCGPTGSGKTTSLASMIEYINENFKRNIITVEDPIEYLHSHGKSLIHQRELGHDAPSFSEALVSALRQDPDVILIGEMRDRVTMETALMASETGHVVLSTVHTFGAASSMDRIIDTFPADQQAQIRFLLANNLAAVLSQQLLTRKDGKGVIVAAELLTATPSVKNLIREGKTFLIPNELQMGAKYGMCLFENELKRLIREGIVSEDVAKSYNIQITTPQTAKA